MPAGLVCAWLVCVGVVRCGCECQSRQGATLDLVADNSLLSALNV